MARSCTSHRVEAGTARLLLAGFAAEVAPEVRDEAGDLRPMGTGAEVEDAGIEDGGATTVVDGHFGRFAGSEVVTDDSENSRVRGRGGVALIDLDPVVPESAAGVEAGAGEQPAGGARADNAVGMVGKGGLVPADILGSDESGLGAGEIAPARAAGHRVAGDADLVEKVVGREKGEVASQIAVALDHVVDMGGDVLLVPGEDDQAVVAQRWGARALEIVVGDEVGPVAASPVPAQEAEVEAEELIR